MGSQRLTIRVLLSFRVTVSDRCPVCLSVCLSVCPVCNVGVLWPNGWMDQDETWHAGGLGPGHIVLDGDPAPRSPKRGQTPNYRPMSVVAKRLDQDATLYADRPRPRHIVLDGTQLPPQKKMGQTPNFRPMSIVAKRLSASGYHLVQASA